MFKLSVSDMVREARERKGWSRQQAIQRLESHVANAGGKSFDQSTLGRYERNENPIPAHALALLIEVLELKDGNGIKYKAEDLLTTAKLSRPMRVGYSMFPDSIFLRAVAMPNLLDRVLRCPEIDAKPLPVSWSRTLDALVDTEEKESDIDIAFFNEADFIDRKRKDSEGRYQSVEAIAGSQLVEYHGYAILSTHIPAWKTFGTHFYDSTKIDSEADMDALVNTLAQFAEQEAQIFVASDTDMEKVLFNIHRLAVKVDPDNFALKKFKELLEASTSQTETREDSAFINFLEVLKAKELQPAIFIGGLSERLLAQACGAKIMIEHHELRRIGFFDFGEMEIEGGELVQQMKLLSQPCNILIANRSFMNNGREQIEALQDRWNSAVDWINEPNDLPLIYSWFDERIDEHIQSLNLANTDILLILLKRRRSMFKKILDLNLIQFNKWTQRIVGVL